MQRKLLPSLITLTSILSTVLPIHAAPVTSWNNPGVSAINQLSNLNDNALKINSYPLAPQQIAQIDPILGKLNQIQGALLEQARSRTSSNLRWDNVSFEVLNSQEIKVNLHGKVIIPVLRDKNIRLGLIFQPFFNGNQVQVRATGYDYRISSCGLICKKKARSAFRDFEQELPSIQQAVNEQINR